MTIEDEAARWRRLMDLMAPIHEAARRTARRLCRSPDEGDDLFQEALLRGFEAARSGNSGG